MSDDKGICLKDWHLDSAVDEPWRRQIPELDDIDFPAFTFVGNFGGSLVFGQILFVRVVNHLL